MVTVDSPGFVLAAIVFPLLYIALIVMKPLRIPYRPTWIGFLSMLAASCTMLAASNPKLHSATSSYSLVIAMDVSFTMRASPPGGDSRFIWQRRFVRNLLSRLPGYVKTALITFDRDMHIITPTWQSPREVSAYVEDIVPNDVPKGTAMWDVILAAVEWAEASAPSGVLLLITDGLDTEGDINTVEDLRTQWRICPVLVGTKNNEQLEWEGQIYPITVDASLLFWLSGQFNCPGFPIHAQREPAEQAYQKVFAMLDTSTGGRSITLGPWLLLISALLPIVAGFINVLRKRSIL
ncbi:MAG: VWA domain-containing protein [Candidatus Methanomethylicaceae archaeon]